MHSVYTYGTPHVQGYVLLRALVYVLFDPAIPTYFCNFTCYYYAWQAKVVIIPVMWKVDT